MADTEKDIKAKEEQTAQEEVMSRLHGDKVIWAIFFLLSLISIALIYSASSSLAYMKGSSNFAILMKQVRFVVLGVAALFICYKVPPKWYRAVSMLALLLAIVLLVLTLAVGVKTNDAQRWLSIGGLQFQPTEFAKIAIVLYLARALEIMKIDTYKSFLIKIIAPIGFCIVLVLVGSVSAALYLALICFIVLFIAGIKPSYLLKTVGLGAAAVVLLIVVHLASKPFTSEHRGVFPRMDTAIERFNRFFQSEESESAKNLSPRELQKIADETLQADMAQIAVKEGGLLGKGPGKSTQRYVLPHPYSDYIYSIILEEYGLAGGFLVMMLYVWFFYRCVLIVKGCRTVFSAVTAGGLGAVILVQAMLHILVNVGIFPVTGHTLPLISLGGTSFIIISCAFGIILSISRTKEDAEAMIQEKQRQEKEQKRLERELKREEERQAAQAEQLKQEAMTQEERDEYLKQRYADQLGREEDELT